MGLSNYKISKPEPNLHLFLKLLQDKMELERRKLVPIQNSLLIELMSQ